MNEGAELINQVVQFRGKITGFDSLLVIMDHRLICNPDSTMVDDLSIEILQHLKEDVFR